MATNYYINVITRFLKKQIVFISIMTMFLWLILYKLIEPVMLLENYSLNLSFLPSHSSYYTIDINGDLLSKIKMVYYIISIIGLFALSNSIYERFLYNYFASEKEVKWYDVKSIKYPFDPNNLQIIIGQVHNEDNTELAEKPYYESIRGDGLFQNILIIGTIGTGKTITAMVQITLQLIYLLFTSVKDKAAMLFLDVKGNFYKFVFAFAVECFRWKDVISLELGGKWKYNPIHKPNLSEIELANRMRYILDLMAGKDADGAYWVDKAEDTITELLKLIRLYNNGYVNFEELHNIGSKNSYREEKIAELEAIRERGELNEDQEYKYLTAISYFENEYKKLPEKAQAFIQSEITRMTQPFISTKLVKDTFSPSADEINFYGFEDVIKEGKIVVWKINANKQPKVAKMVAAYLKLDFQKEILITLDNADKDPVSAERIKVTVCDEYQEYCTPGDADFLSQSREARSITVAATQSYSSIKKALKNDETMTNMLLQSFVNKIWLRTDDVEYTVPKVMKQVGKVDKEKITTSITESSRNSKVNYSIGKVLGKGKNLSSGTTISIQKEYLFDETFLSQKLGLGQAVCFLTDGENVVGPKVIHLNKLFEGRIICDEDGKVDFTTDKDTIFKNIGEIDLDNLEKSIFPEVVEDKRSMLNELKTYEELNFTPEAPKKLNFVIEKKQEKTHSIYNDNIISDIKEEVHQEEVAISRDEDMRELPLDLDKNMFDF